LPPVAILTAFVLTVIGDIINTFQSTGTLKGPGPTSSVLQTTVNLLSGRDRVLQLFDFGSILWAVALLVGLALLISGARASGTRLDAGPHGVVAKVFVLGSGLVVVAAIIDVIVWVSYLGESTALGVHSVLVGIGTAVVAAASGLWALSVGGSGRAAPTG